MKHEYTSLLHSHLRIVFGTCILIIALKHFEDYAIEQIQIIKISSSRYTEIEEKCPEKADTLCSTYKSECIHTLFD